MWRPHNGLKNMEKKCNTNQGSFFLPKEWINFKKVNVQFFPKVLLNGSLNIADEKAKLMP